jgi:hypothetical protein
MAVNSVESQFSVRCSAVHIRQMRGAGRRRRQGDGGRRPPKRGICHVLACVATRKVVWRCRRGGWSAIADARQSKVGRPKSPNREPAGFATPLRKIGTAKARQTLAVVWLPYRRTETFESTQR